MRRATIAAATISLAVSATFLSAAHSQEAEQRTGGRVGDETTPTADETAARDAEVRGNLGLDSSPETARRLRNDPAAVKRGAAFGFPVAADEFQDLTRRLDVQQGSSPVFERAEQISPQTYAGGWLDLAKGHIVLSYTDEDPSRRATLQQQARRPEAIQVVRADYPLGMLQSGSLRIYRDGGRGAGVEVIATEVIESRNRVVVTVTRPTESTGRQVAAAYGMPEGSLEIQAPRGESREFTTILGGHAVANSIDAWSHGAYGWEDTQFGRIPFFITAGHAGEALRHTTGGRFPTSSADLHDPVIDMNREVNSGAADAQRMLRRDGVLAPTIATVEGYQLPDFTLTGEAVSNGEFDRQGAMVCQAGARSAGQNNCNTLRTNAQNACGHEQMRAVNGSVFAVGGDSGGTVYGFIFGQSRVPLTGFVEGICNGDVRYTWVKNARVALGLGGWYFG